MQRFSFRFICLLAVVASCTLGCQEKPETLPAADETTSQSSVDLRDNSATNTSDPSKSKNSDLTGSLSDQSDLTPSNGQDTPPSDATNRAADGTDYSKHVTAESEMSKSATGLIVKNDELPGAEISDEASDFSIEPEYVDPRKHDPVFEAKDEWVKLAKDYPLWIDREKKQVVVDGRIAQIHALLEMFACPVDSGKEHESIVGVYCESELLHAALLAIGAKAGHPVVFQPEFKPAEGTKIEIEVVWEEDGKRKTVDAKKWIRNLKTKELLTVDWVFGGSQFYVDDRTGNKYYLANGGELVCVSNFATAMMDLPAKSSADAAQQEYEANTDEIPALGTPVRLIFKPDLDSFQPAEEIKKLKEKASEQSADQESKDQGGSIGALATEDGDDQ